MAQAKSTHCNILVPRSGCTISIIIPVWGEYHKYLGECLDSVKQQTYQDYEVIEVDIPNLPKARNEGIGMAQGEYILPLDVDDRLHPCYLERVINGFNCGYDVMTTDHEEFEEHGSRSQWSDTISLEDILRGHNKPIACSAFKRKLWEKIGGYDESFSSGYEDWDFWIRMAEAGAKMNRVNDVLYFYRKHTGSMSDGIVENKDLLKKLINKHGSLRAYHEEPL